MDTEGFTVLLTNLLDLSESLAVVREWVKGPTLGSRLVKVTKELCSGKLDKDSESSVRVWDMVSVALSTGKDGGRTHL